MAEETKDTLTYIGRKPGLKHHRYILGSNREELYFSKKLQKRHEVSETYPVTITTNENGQRLFATSGRDDPIELTWVLPELVAAWARDDTAAQTVDRAQREAKGLETAARKAARTIKRQYDRASALDKRAIIRTIVKELES